MRSSEGRQECLSKPSSIRAMLATCVTSFAEKHGVGLVMMPTHGYGPFRGLLLGSVAAKVLHDAKCPVWTAAHTEQPELPGRPDIKNILCAVDLQPESVGLICCAAGLAREFNADLRLVHAVPLAAPAEKYRDTDFVGWLFHKSRLEIAKYQEQAGTNVELCVMGGSVSTLVRDAALQYKADLVVVGRGRLHEPFGRLRTGAYAIIRDSPCPVLSL